MTFVSVSHFHSKYDFVPWNIMTMTVLTGLTGGFAFVTGLVTATGGALHRKVVILVVCIYQHFSKR